MNRIFSDFMALNWYDLTKGAIVSVLTAVLTALYKIIENGDLPTGKDLETTLKVGLAALLGYLIKNLFTDSAGTVRRTERKKRSY